MKSSRSTLVWKISALYLFTTIILHALLVVFLWGYAKSQLLQLAVEVPAVTPQLAQQVSGRLGVAALGCVVIILAVMIGAAIMSSLRVTDALGMLASDAERIAEGDLKAIPHHSEFHELDRLADAMNRMVAQLDERIRIAAQHGKEREAIFASMVEGVIAVDDGRRIIELNPAAYSLCGIPSSIGAGAALEEALPMPQVTALIDGILEHKPPRTSLVVEFHRATDGATRILEMQATPLGDGAHIGAGALLVLHDVTDLRHLERIRQDFVANVSHELRTPITSIQGFVETLLEGALTDPRVSRRFVEIIRKHAERLRTLIDDLLMLARVEEREEQGTLSTQQVEISELLRSVADWCMPLAKDKHIALSLESSVRGSVRVNQSLFEQALVNLVENAIKFTEPGGNVTLLAREHQQGIVFAVRDTGIGIEKEHLPRVFERFYRADRSRSRNEGGTGLGLAIVKHIVRAHGGDVEVSSQIGRGSTFTVRVPEHIRETPDILGETTKDCDVAPLRAVASG